MEGVIVKIIVYDKNTLSTDFNNYGYGLLTRVISCKITEELNGRYELDMEVLLSDSKAKYLTKWAIIRANGQLFRINTIKKNDKNRSIVIYAKHIFYDLDFAFIEDRRFENMTIGDVLKTLMPKDFEEFKGTSNLLHRNTIYCVKDNGVTALFNIMERWGDGELVRDNFNYAINDSAGEDRGVTFTYRKVDGIEITEEYEDVVTRIYPTGKDGITLKEKYIEVPNWSAEDFLPRHITREVKFEGAENEGELRAVATLEAQRLGLSRTNFKIDVNMLADTVLYKHIPELMQVNIGDTVTIKHQELGIRTRVKVIKKELDIITKSCKIELGQPLNNFFKSVDNSNVRMQVDGLDSLKSGIYYYNNGVETILNTSEYESLGYTRFGTNEDAHLLSFVTANIISDKDCEVHFKMRVDNTYQPFEPKASLTKGNNLISFSYPLLYMEGNVSHTFHLESKVVNQSDVGDANVRILKQDLHITLFGQNLASGMGAEYPHAEVIEELSVSSDEWSNIPKPTSGATVKLIKPIVISPKAESQIIPTTHNVPIDVISGIKQTPILFMPIVTEDAMRSLFDFDSELFKFNDNGMGLVDSFTYDFYHSYADVEHYYVDIITTDCNYVEEVIYE